MCETIAPVAEMSGLWGKPVVIENRPGGDGFIAITGFAGARDDHTLLFSPTSAFAAHPYLHEKLPYDPRDLLPIARVSSTLVGVGVPIIEGWVAGGTGDVGPCRTR